MRTTLLTALFLAIFLSGCGATKMQKIHLGMTRTEVTEAIGEPKDVLEARSYSSKEVEVWEYKEFMGDTYRVYFTNGKVKSWQRDY